MPVSQEKLTAALEIIASAGKSGTLPAAVSIAAETVGAREFGLITIRLRRDGAEAAVRAVTVHAGELRPETIKRHVHQRVRWWNAQPAQATRPVLPQLFQADPDFASDAFRFAREPLIRPKLSALCAYQKTDPEVVSAFLAGDIGRVPPVTDLVLFHSQASLLFGFAGAARRGATDVAKTNLSPRERECLLWSARGKTSFEIARILGLSEHTVNHYLVSSVTKLNASNRAQAIVRAMKTGILPIGDI